MFVCAYESKLHDIVIKTNFPPLFCKNCVQTLLEFGADVNACDHLMRTPLHHACNAGNLDAVKVLVGIDEADLLVKRFLNNWLITTLIIIEYNKRKFSA